MNQSSALIASLILEVPLVLAAGAALARWRPPQPPLSAWLQAGLAATLLTHPFAWWLNTQALRGVLPMWPRMLLIEALVALAEGLLFGWLCGRWAYGLAIATAVNAFSFGLGLIWAFWLA